MADSKKVVFGISNVHYALFKDGEEGGYEAPVPWPGAVRLALTAEGNSDKFYADNMPYATFETNAGYTGELEMAYVDDKAMADLLSAVVDANGQVLEDAEAVSKHFALLFEVSSNESPDRFTMFDCTMGRPDSEASTKTDSTEPNTVTLPFTAIPREFAWGEEGKRKFTKARITRKAGGDTSKFDSFYDAVLVPTAPAASQGE